MTQKINILHFYKKKIYIYLKKPLTNVGKNVKKKKKILIKTRPFWAHPPLALP